MIPENFNSKNINESPEYFGAYFNMARHNIFLLINHLTEVFRYLPFNIITDDDNISNKENNILLNIFDISKKEFDEERSKVYNYIIKRHLLPIIKYIGQNKENDLVDFDKIHNFLLFAFNEINEFRNEYTHFLAIDDNGNVLPRKNFIAVELNPVLHYLFTNAPRISYLRNEAKQSEEDYNHILSNYEIFTDGKLNDKGIYFFINLFIERKYAIKFLKKIKGFKNETKPEFRATLQTFTSYCLKLPDTRLSNDFPKQTILMEMLSELNKCPKELFNHLTEEDKMKFEPQINDEKKTNILFNSFKSDYDEEKNFDELIADLTTLKRYEDRFPIFALRFIDEIEAFTQIRFQITLGKIIVKKPYYKTIIGNPQPRRVTKTVNVYGKLSDFIGRENDILKELKKDLLDNSIEFEQFAPHYNTNNNKIAFKIFDKEKVNKIQYPSIFENKKEIKELHNTPSGFISINDLHKIVLLDLITGNKQEAEKKIVQFVNITNAKILNETFLTNIKNKTNYNPEIFTKRFFDNKKLLNRRDNKIHFVTDEKVERLLKKYNLDIQQLYSLTKDDFNVKALNRDRNTYNKQDIETFSQIKYKYFLDKRREELQKHLPENILVNHFPRRIIDYLMNISEINSVKRIHLKIREIKDETELLLKAVRKEPKEGQVIKLGEIATFIAKDILNMLIDKEVKNKITSPYYNKIQNKLAYFSINKEDLIKIFEELQIFDINRGHVFLQKNHIYKSNSLIDFYKNYLEAKINWINNLHEKGKEGGYRLNKTNKKIPYSFSDIKKQCEDFNFTNWLAQKNKLPVNIPNSLLNRILNEKLKKQLKEADKEYSEKDVLSVLLSKILEKDSQSFYYFDRKYKDYGTKKEPNYIVIEQINGLNVKTIKRKYGNYVDANEKLIRFYQTRDQVMKLMCDYLINEDRTIGLQNGFLLKSIYPNSTISILEQPAKFLQIITKKEIERNKQIQKEQIIFTVIAEDTEKQKKEIEKWNLLNEEQKLFWTRLITTEDQQSFLATKTEEEKKIYLGQKGYQWTFKDYGRFKRFVKDKRLNGLATYFETTEIPFDLLEYQLMEYDKYREKILELVFNLEKTIYNKDPLGIIKLDLIKRPKDFNQVQFDIFLNWLKTNNYSFDENIINWGRNKFSHTEFPIFNLDKITNEQIENFEYNKNILGRKEAMDISIAKKIVEKFENEVNNIISQIV